MPVLNNPFRDEGRSVSPGRVDNRFNRKPVVSSPATQPTIAPTSNLAVTTPERVQKLTSENILEDGTTIVRQTRTFTLNLHEFVLDPFATGATPSTTYLWRRNILDSGGNLEATFQVSQVVDAQDAVITFKMPKDYRPGSSINLTVIWDTVVSSIFLTAPLFRLIITKLDRTNGVFIPLQGKMTGISGTTFDSSVLTGVPQAFWVPFSNTQFPARFLQTAAALQPEDTARLTFTRFYDVFGFDDTDLGAEIFFSELSMEYEAVE